MKTAKMKAKCQLPANVPKWKHLIHSHALRLARLIELNAPDILIKREVTILNEVLFDAVEITVAYYETPNLNRDNKTRQGT